MTLPDRFWREPWLYDFFAVLRRLEREHPDQPRIGESAAMREDYVALGQNPYMDFPASMLAGAERVDTGDPERDRTRIQVRFLGLLGPQGALPYAITEEAYHWLLARDDSFPRFLSLFENRFLQLFFRAWADVRPTAQHDRAGDRFADWVGSTIGIGSAPYRDLDTLPDKAKLGFAGLIGAQVRSTARLRALLRALLGVDVEIEEFTGSWLAFDPADRTRLGAANARLGGDLLLGASAFSVEDKITIHLHAPTLAAFETLLPDGRLSDPMNDAIFFFLGHDVAWDVEIALPAREAAPMRLSQSGQLGWTSWLAPPPDPPADAVRRDARYQASERHFAKRRRAAAEGPGP